MGYWVILNKLHRKKVVGKWSADHLLTTYRPLTDYLTTDHLPTTYWPHTDHIPTDHIPTTYQPLTDHIPTTYRILTNHFFMVQLVQYYWGIGQSDLADRMEDSFIGQNVVVWVWRPNYGSFCCSQLFVHQVWLSTGLPEVFTPSCWVWLWIWLIVFRC